MDDSLKKKLLSISYVATIFYSLHCFALYFVFSAFLNQYFSKVTLSILFALSAILSIIASNIFGKSLKRFSNQKSLLAILFVQLVVTLFLSMSGELANYLIATLFTLHIVLYTLISVSVNVFVEEFSDHENIGSIRGTMLTIYNFGAVASPFIAAQIFSLVGFSGLFILSALSLLPLIYITKKFFSHVKEPKYKHINLFSSFRIVLKDKNIRGVIVSSFILNAFYAAVNVYLALYLLETIGIPASLYLGLIVPITVIPFILIPYQLGKYSDEIFGEKKAMIAGIFILSVALIIIPGFNITTNNIFVWIILLFIARVGATITETENYAYFYKKIDGRSAGLIALFQNMVNVSFVFVTLLGAILLNLFNIDLPVIFLIVGLLGLLSIFIIIKIRDTEIKRRKTIAKANIHIKKEEEVKEVLAEAEWEISKAKRN
ncbi:MAG: hypothetical protein RI945_54 [Candidatus Parcubacteria bacterium]